MCYLDSCQNEQFVTSPKTETQRCPAHSNKSYRVYGCLFYLYSGLFPKNFRNFSPLLLWCFDIKYNNYHSQYPKSKEVSSFEKQ